MSDRSNGSYSGIDVKNDDVLTFNYIETQGTVEAILNIIKTNKLTMVDDTLNVVGIDGYNLEENNKIRKLAPLLYTTGKRTVTESDFRIIINMYPLIKDCVTTTNETLCCTIDCNYIREGSGEINIPLTKAEIKEFKKWFYPYSVSPEVYIPATPIIANWNFM